MRGALNAGVSLAQTAVTNFGQAGSLVVNPSDEYDYEYVLDCQPTAQNGPLAIALSNFSVQLRNRETLGLEYESVVSNQFVAHESTVNEIWTSQINPWSIATCSSDETVKFWDLRARAPTMTIPFGQEVWSLSVGCGDSLLVGGTNEKAHFYDVRGGKKLGAYGESHMDPITRVRFHPTNLPFVVTASEDGVVCFFDCRIPNEDDAIESILNVESSVSKIGFFGPQNENLFCLTGTETLDLWNIWTAERIHHYQTLREDCAANGVPTDYLIDCIYDQQSTELFLLAGDHNGTMNVLNIGGGNGQLRHEAALMNGHKACVRTAYYAPEQNTLYTGGEDARLCRWSPGSGAAAAIAATPAPDASLAQRRTADPAGLKKARKSSRPY
ncbi:hypothetical protein Poli38472_008326 [Pythium oligandrum]|uniref:Uncharacterized protein n=1 Tax=Pythium oligandrum TaxID=41045 RepID=A0A8K1FLX1_PYTOL|nr:hypothetical protein Poli38472_008326 [Pythium oligandrum]|eukprot:TMW65684.1 hypothetical protein Poli38472_008326 [Pythium oligandrum]